MEGDAGLGSNSSASRNSTRAPRRPKHRPPAPPVPPPARRAHMCSMTSSRTSLSAKANTKITSILTDIIIICCCCCIPPNSTAALAIIPHAFREDYSAERTPLVRLKSLVPDRHGAPRGEEEERGRAVRRS
ncbi:unnamed protein product [Lampetra planeri]